MSSSLHVVWKTYILLSSTDFKIVASSTCYSVRKTLWCERQAWRRHRDAVTGKQSDAEEFEEVVAATNEALAMKTKHQT